MTQPPPQDQDDQISVETLESDDDVELHVFEIHVRRHLPGRRIDAYLAGRFGDYSRTFIQRLIEAGGVQVNGGPVKRSYKVQPNDRIVAHVPVLRVEVAEPEEIALDILYEDDWILVVNKQADMVVHPSRGHTGGTLVNALAWHCRSLSQAGGPLRPGIVHRLDKDTTGVILVVKDERIHEEIARQFEYRETQKEYLAIAEGRIELDGDVIDLPIGRHRSHQERMAIRHDIGRPAQTRYQVVERLGNYTVVRCFPKTGRTHQIRVHMMAIGHPLVADSHYSHADALYPSDVTGEPATPDELPLLDRQALHARSLTLHHPVLDRDMTFEAPVPPDMQRAVDFLRAHAVGRR